MIWPPAIISELRQCGVLALHEAPISNNYLLLLFQTNIFVVYYFSEWKHAFEEVREIGLIPNSSHSSRVLNFTVVLFMV